MANINVNLEITGIERYKKALNLLIEVVDAGDQLIATPVESAAYSALLNIYKVARAKLMRFEKEVEHE